MATIHTINVDGTNYDIKSTHYATSATGSTTANKTASIQNGSFALQTGVKVSVKFSYANAVASPTLNVNSSGAKSIYYQGSALASKSGWKAGQVVDFVYDGTRWHIIGLSDALTWNTF